MKNQANWKLIVLIGVIFLVLYPIEQKLIFGTESLFNVVLAAGLTAGISAGIAVLIHQLLWGRKNSK
jgi:hypothetical protein